ncbi:diacylglycerol kinase family protein [Staphylococcus pragensis]|uniref:Diacylglycerol kinase family protein n=1 Tax=Staphylococcus pragensis TaxID=1611836 RepID=A0A4Z1C9A6_9STAP|nr:MULTISPECIES: diacylglycerol kinase family protein [Staphylococcus]RTX87594.1 diacylglycerol kinase family protein [Staphylococcus carnosus]TGN28891.1 diacylglycerol kinase family protein [Staphylococcus pragensis]
MNRFKYTFDGFKTLLIKDHNYLLHMIVALIVIVLGFVFHLNRFEWMFIILAIVLVLTLEAVNTAIECVVDLVTMDYHELAKQAKDIAAFSVMLVSIFALIIGLIIFIPHIF